MLGAGAGIAAWVAVVGGARVWARLKAIDAPADQTVTVLPREMLITEGLRTLLVPLLLGAAIAILAYLSRRADAEYERPTWRIDADDLTGAMTALQAEVTAAQARTKSAEEMLQAAGRWATEVEEGRADAAQLHRRVWPALVTVRAAASRLRGVAAMAYELSIAAPDAYRRDRLEKLRGSANNAAAGFEHARDDLVRDLGDPSGLDGKRAQAAIRSALTAIGNVDVAPVRKGLRAVLDVPLRKRARTAIAQLGPVEYLLWWRRRLADGPGPAAAFAALIVLALGFGGIALAIVNAAPEAMEWAAAVCLGVFALLVAIGFGWRGWVHWAAFVALVATLPAIALAGFISALQFKYIWYAILLTALTIWFALGALRRSTGAAATAWILFVTIAVWSGALAFISERGAKVTTLGTAVAFQKDTPYVSGLFLGRTSKAVYLASPDQCSRAGCSRTVIGVPDKQVTCLVLGRSVDVHNDDEGKIKHGDNPFHPNAIKTAALSRYVEVSDATCDQSKKGSTPPPNTTPAPTVTSNSFNLLNHVRLVLGRAAKPAPTVTPSRLNVLNGLRIMSRPPPTPAPDVRTIGPFQIVVGNSATPEPRRPRRIKLVLDDDVLFRFASAKLTASGAGRLKKAARAVRRSGAQRVFVAGHTDSIGTKRHNARLSRRRAAAVEQALRARLGDSGPAIHSHGYGETKPIACNTHRNGTDDWVARAYNRRVEIWTGREPRYPKLNCSQ